MDRGITIICMLFVFSLGTVEDRNVEAQNPQENKSEFFLFQNISVYSSIYKCLYVKLFTKLLVRVASTFWSCDY